MLADAERERGELATQLIARDRQVSELQARLSHVELTSSELEAALRAQLDLATQQCDQYEARVRDLDNSTKVRQCVRQTTLKTGFTFLTSSIVEKISNLTTQKLFWNKFI